MPKSALALLFSMVFAVFSAPAALAKEVLADAAQPKKASAHKSVGAKAKIVASHGGRKRVIADHKRKNTNGAAIHKRKTAHKRALAAPVAEVIPAKPTFGDMAGLNHTHDPLDLKSNVAFVMDQATSEVLFDKNSRVALPMASITKLMTALVVLDSQQDMNEILEVTSQDVDYERNSGSRLRVGAQLSRTDMLHIALMSSENRAASALGRSYPGGLSNFVKRMNEKARMIGMTDTVYVDSTGLSSRNVASARDLAKLVSAAYNYPIVRQYSTDTRYIVEPGGRALQYSTSNGLVKNPEWDIGLQKTGYISEAGRCLVMQAKIEGRPVVMVFLDSKGKQSRLGDAGRVRKWLQTSPSTLSGTHVVAKQS
ncbi:serine hydrolase [Herminiimonas sp. CN]|uniref:serine hydrolase n=1 Tax=Herminiimonas sp. CN TaxID=1349818 RepID=UPI0004738335|nr:serine hydrolase [Herminiimonas sp. CN]